MIRKNSRNVSAWSLEKGYRVNLTDGEYPFRVFDSGKKGALELVLTSFTQDRDFMCSQSRQGYNIFLTLPGDSLESLIEIRSDVSEDIQISFKSKIITTSKALRRYRPAQRGCFYYSERQLRFFKLYTAHNCIIECLANFTERECGCVGYSMPSMQ